MTCCGFGQIGYQNTPPVMYMDRNWKIPETAKVDTVISRVEARDAEHDVLTFDLEPVSPIYNEEKTNERLPFRIDPNTGFVYLNESLLGRGDENFFLYVTVTDGTVTSKTQVLVNILSKNPSTRNSRPPYTPDASNLSHLLPQFNLLPGVAPPSFPTNSTRPNIYPPYQTNTYVKNKTSYADGDDHKNEPSHEINENKNNKTTVLVAVDNNNIQQEHANSNQHPINLKDDNSVKAILPIIFTICGIFLAAGIIAIFIFRKHLCAFGKSLKKKSKEEMAKKSNQSNISSTITEDSRNSMVLQHWNGPTAFSNRYVPWERDNQHMQATSQLSTSSTIVSSPMKSDRWEFPRHRLKFFNILGEGAFGQVWRCEAVDIDGLKGVTTVAVKTLKENATEIERNDLHSELQVMKSLEPHTNVVRLLGSCTEKEPIFVILEYVNKGKLQTYLRNSRAERHYGNTHGKSNILTSGDLTSFMYQVARGMDYLTSRGIIHRDLAARNILITDDHRCKVADFGFARDVITSKVYERKSEGKLPIRWMAIESLYDNIFSVKSDIWSFGILMWEIVTLGSTPYPGIAAADVMRKVRDGYRLEKPEHCRRELYNIMYYCWAEDFNERPSFSELVQLLDKLLLTEMDYIELERFPDHNYYNMKLVLINFNSRFDAANEVKYNFDE
ncbi:Tyrosine kinase receptor Cad96Ca [Pseudolycoriella hygida]|uniref:receptor protein-tyrosine kinase n=1 Tax=Pseudolycoriella hygida TaxID=35572 RepID=A0A9Q0MTW0_9DIPT|nr:Tyrosine kinase receptor Cad96Ca [Pseudolycoriella hygida]